MIDQPDLEPAIHLPFQERTVALVDELVGCNPPFMEELWQGVILRHRSPFAARVEQTRSISSGRAVDVIAVHPLLINGRADDGGPLHRIDRLSHVPLGNIDDRVHRPRRDGKPLPVLQCVRSLLLLPRPERFEPVDRAPALDRVNNLGGIIAGEDEPAGLGIALHGPAERGLRIRCQGIRFIQEKDLEGRIPGGHGPGKLLDLVAHTSIPRSSEAFISRKFLCHVSPKNSLARATAAVVLPTPHCPVNRRWGRLPSGHRREALHDLVLPDDFRQFLRAVFFYPDRVALIHEYFPGVQDMHDPFG